MSPHDHELRALLDEGRTLDRPLPRSSAGPNPGWSRALRAEMEQDVAPEDEGPVVEGASGPRGRPAAALQQTWIDPEEVPFTPAVRPGRELPARLFSLAVLAAVVSFLAWMIVPEVSFRVTNIDRVGVRNGVLTAQPVPLASPVAAVVQELWVDPSQPPTGIVPAGTVLARLRPTAAVVEGDALTRLEMPFDGRIASVDTLVGAVTTAEMPVVTVYDPAHMYVVVTVRPATLRRLREGMRARLTSALVADPVSGVVVSAVPLLGDAVQPADDDLVNVRIRPDPDQVADLVPGIRFDASIDTTSAPPGAEPLVVAPSPAADR